jgi:hypothetical protein
MESDNFTLSSPTMVELWTRMREMGNEDVEDVEDTNGNVKSGI